MHQLLKTLKFTPMPPSTTPVPETPLIKATLWGDGLVGDGVTIIDGGGGGGGYGQEAFNKCDGDEEEDEHFDSFPPGYRFKPLDEELVLAYLMPRIENSQLPPNRIKEIELYKYNPETLAATYKCSVEGEWYFFTPRERKYLNGERPNRAAEDGYWKATGVDKDIRKDEVGVGFKKALVFYLGKPPRGLKTDWIMHEYRVSNTVQKRRRINNNDMRLDDWVICRIHKKAAKLSKVFNRQRDNAQEVKPMIENEIQAYQIRVGNEHLVHPSRMQKKQLKQQGKSFISKITKNYTIEIPNMGPHLKNNFENLACFDPNSVQNGLLPGAFLGLHNVQSDQSCLYTHNFNRNPILIEKSCVSQNIAICGYSSPLYDIVDQYISDDLQSFENDICHYFLK